MRASAPYSRRRLHTAGERQKASAPEQQEACIIQGGEGGQSPASYKPHTAKDGIYSHKHSARTTCARSPPILLANPRRECEANACSYLPPWNRINDPVNDKREFLRDSKRLVPAGSCRLLYRSLQRLTKGLRQVFYHAHLAELAVKTAAASCSCSATARDQRSDGNKAKPSVIYCLATAVLCHRPRMRVFSMRPSCAKKAVAPPRRKEYGRKWKASKWK